MEEAQTCWPTRLRSTLALDVENLPAPAVSLEEQDSVAADKKESVYKPKAGAGKITAWYNRCDIRVQTRERRPFPSLS